MTSRPTVWCPPPEVPYTSFEEYREGIRACVEGFTDMSASSINITTVDEFGMGFSIEKAEWPVLGAVCLFRLTKQKGFQWCESVNKIIMEAILQHCFDAFFQINTNGDTHQMLHILRDVAQKTVSHLLGIGGLGLYSMNFVDLIDHDFPVTKSKWREHQLAVAMAAHPRLGRGSPLWGLGEDLMKMIVLK